MKQDKTNNYPKTQHKKAAGNGRDKNEFVVLDNPDDRLTRQTGSGRTLVQDDNPDDAEM